MKISVALIGPTQRSPIATYHCGASSPKRIFRNFPYLDFNGSFLWTSTLVSCKNVIHEKSSGVFVHCYDFFVLLVLRSLLLSNPLGSQNSVTESRFSRLSVPVAWSFQMIGSGLRVGRSKLETAECNRCSGGNGICAGSDSASLRILGWRGVSPLLSASTQKGTVPLSIY